MKIDKEVDEIDRIEEGDLYVGKNLNQEILDRRKEVHPSMWSSLHLKESILRQKARHKWVVEGDRNSKFFHSVLKAMSRKNSIVAVLSNQGVVEGVEEIKGVAREHCETRFIN